MDKFLLVFILAICIKTFGQKSHEDLAVYESFLNEIIEFELGGYEKIKVIPQFKNSKDPFYDDIVAIKREIEEINRGTYSFQYDLLHGENLESRFREEPRFIESVYQLVSNFKDHPKIDKTKLTINDNVAVSYDSYSKVTGWLKSKKKQILSKVTLSRIQYNGEICTFYFSYSCGDLCGYGGIAFMEKKDEEWIYLGSFEMWMS